MSLFFKECKVVVKSPVNYIYFFFICLFLYIGYIHSVNFSRDNNYYKAPRKVDILSVMETQNSMTLSSNPYNKFMLIPVADKNIVIEAAMDSLWANYWSNSYFITMRNTMEYISLSERKQERIYNLLLEIEDYVDNSENDIDMDDFYHLLRKAGAIIGSNNDYKNPDMYFNRDRRRISFDLATYDEALVEYNKFAVQDGISGGLARIFAGYINIACFLLGAVVAVFHILKDNKVEEILSSKSILSGKLLAIKYIAVNIVLFLPIFIFAVIATIHAGWIAQEVSAMKFDSFAFLKLSVLWVFPTVMFTTAFSMLITVATGTPIALIMLAPIWWLQMGITDSFGLHMIIINFYSEFSFDLHRIARTEIIINRLFYTGISIILVCAAIGLYHLKRGGRWNVQNLFRSMQKKH